MDSLMAIRLGIEILKPFTEKAFDARSPYRFWQSSLRPVKAFLESD